nr:hypothetical protein CFP56_73956 [Quercus suber]
MFAWLDPSGSNEARVTAQQQRTHGDASPTITLADFYFHDTIGFCGEDCDIQIKMLARYSALGAALLSLAAAQTTTTAPTASASFWAPLDLSAGGGYAASIVNICSDTTTYNLACSDECIAFAPLFDRLVDLGFLFHFRFGFEGWPYERHRHVRNHHGRHLQFLFVRPLEPSHLHLTEAGAKTQTDERHSVQVPITAGADKIGSSQGTCTGGAVPQAVPFLLSAAAVGALAGAILL